MLLLYKIVVILLYPFVLANLMRRKSRGKEHETRFEEKLGQITVKRPKGKLIWFHAVSIGESLSIISLIHRIRKDDPDVNILVTTSTLASEKLMAQRLPERCIHQFAPLDFPWIVKAFLDHWKPNAVLWVESEFWPNKLLNVTKRGIPLILLNGRISERSYKFWGAFPTTIKKLLGFFSLIVVQSEEFLTSFKKLGAKNVLTFGDLKFFNIPVPVNESDLKALKQSIGSRPFWLAASTHHGEEEIVLHIHKRLKKKHPNLLTILLPRHPERAKDILKRTSLSKKIKQRSQGQMIDDATDVFLVDTLGEVGTFYKLSPIVFVGGSLVPVGGHNILEPAHFDCAIIHGKHMGNFKSFTSIFDSFDASLCVRGESELQNAVDRLLKNEPLRKDYAKRASLVVKEQKRHLEELFCAIKSYLPLRSS